MPQITEWLAKIGLERYAPAFIDNDIDISVLRYLTDADLEKIGVSLEHRRKLLAAISALGGGEAAPTHPAPEPNKQSAAEPSAPAQATRPVGPQRSSASAEAAGERRFLDIALPKERVSALEFPEIAQAQGLLAEIVQRI